MLHFSHAPHAALHCFCSFACVLCANSACLPAIIKSAAAALIFFVLFRWFWICSCLVSLQTASSPDSLPGFSSGKIPVILHCYFYHSLPPLDLLCCILQKFCSADCCSGLVAGPFAIAGKTLFIGAGRHRVTILKLPFLQICVYLRAFCFRLQPFL